MNRYQNILVKKNSNQSSQFYANNIYPDIPFTDTDNYVITTLGDRLDLLANNFYSDPTLWWIISSANSLPGDTLYPPTGMQLRIPTDISEILDQYNSINTIR